MVLSRARLFAIAIFLYGFFLSYFFSPLHFGGDAVHYTNAYNSVSNGTSNIFAARLNYLTYLYSYEYVHFLIVWLSSLIGLEKLLVFSLANGFLYFISFRLAYLYGGSIFLALVLVVTNYYLLALFFTLEKLKIAIIFLLLGVYYIKTNSKVFGAILLLVAPLSHLQVIIYYISYLSSQVFNKKFYK